MTQTFTQDNLKAGLDTFVKGAMRARREAAIEYYERETSNGVLPRKATDGALKLAITMGKPLTDPKQKLRVARQAAGLDARTAITSSVSTATKAAKMVKPLTTLRRLKSTEEVKGASTRNLAKIWPLVVVFSLIGVLFGLWIALLISTLYSQSLPQFGVLVYWATFLLTILFFGMIGWFIGETHRKHQLRQEVANNPA